MAPANRGAVPTWPLPVAGSPKSARSTAARGHHRRVATCRLTGIHRSAHALRRADLLGRRAHAFLLARRHLGGDGELRRRHRALPPRGARDRDARPRQRRGDPVRGAGRGHHLGLGELSRSTWTAAERRNPAINLAFLAPLTPFRHYVMGEASLERAATPAEILRNKRTPRRSDRCRRLRLFQHAA